MKILNKLLNLLYPSGIKCIFCDEELNGTTHNETCTTCLENLPFIKNFCPRCGVELLDNQQGVCLACSRNNYAFTYARAVFNYTAEIIKVIHQFKYAKIEDLLNPLAGYLCDLFLKQNFKIDIICCVPMHANKLKERGFNQSELLAKQVANKFNIPYLDLCIKVKENASQASLDFKHRQQNVKDVYAVNKIYKNEIANKNILLIDDIFTTGATSNEISKLLVQAKAKQVYVLTLAHTPTPQE